MCWEINQRWCDLDMTYSRWEAVFPVHRTCSKQNNIEWWSIGALGLVTDLKAWCVLISITKKWCACSNRMVQAQDPRSSKVVLAHASYCSDPIVLMEQSEILVAEVKPKRGKRRKYPKFVDNPNGKMFWCTTDPFQILCLMWTHWKQKSYSQRFKSYLDTIQRSWPATWLLEVDLPVVPT